MSHKSQTFIRLQREGHDPFIDYLKGICILFVVLNHCLPTEYTNKTLFCLWGSTAVPLFLILQVFHSLKKNIGNITIQYRKIWHRVVYPFLLTELIIISISFLRQVAFGETNSSELFKTILLWGGIGPGCYYPWIYIQFAFVMPFMAKIFIKLEGGQLLVFFLIISTTIDVLGTFIIPMRMYRLLFLRYFFLFYLGYTLVKQGFIINRLTTIIALISMAATLLFYYTEISFFSLGYKKISICCWICYPYIAYGFLRILKYSYNCACLLPFIDKTFRWMGIYSYEIFLTQMFVFSIIK